MSRRTGFAAVGGLTAIAAVLRFATLDRQSFWSDEAVTVLLTRMDLGGLLDAVAGTESTPPLYYVLAKSWTAVFGDGEVGLRSLSALAGTATVPVAARAGAGLLGARAGVGAAAVVAVSPPLVWYSQEARSYALAILLCGLSFAAFASALRRPGGRTLAFWACTSVAAVWTHYFAAFVVVAEAAWLLAGSRDRRVASAVGTCVAAGLAVVPLALEQRGNGFAEFIGASGGLAERAVVVVKQVLVGHALPADRATAAVVALFFLASMVALVVCGSRRQRRAAAVAATVGASSLVAPVALALAGLDYLNTRNALVGVVPLAVAAVAGLAAALPARAGAPALGGLAAVLAAVTVWVSLDADYARPDWRGLADALGAAGGGRALVVTPDHQGWFARVPLQLYLRGARAVDEGLGPAPAQFASIARRPQDRGVPRVLVVREVVLAAVGWDLPTPRGRLPAALREVERRTGPGWTFVRYRGRRPVAVEPARLHAPTSAVLVQPERP